MEEKKYMYRVWYAEIQKYEISRVLDNNVHFTTNKGYEISERISTESYSWFETLEEAVVFLLNETENDLKIFKKRVRQIQNQQTEIIKKYKVEAQNYVGSVTELDKTTSVELGDVELGVYNR
jgi:hypothetical protein